MMDPQHFSPSGVLTAEGADAYLRGPNQKPEPNPAQATPEQILGATLREARDTGMSEDELVLLEANKRAELGIPRMSEPTPSGVLSADDAAARVRMGTLPLSIQMQQPTAVQRRGADWAQTVDAAEEPLCARMLRAFERRTGLPVVINTSFNTAGRPMVDDPRDALEHFGSAPIDALAIGPFLLRRRAL